MIKKLLSVVCVVGCLTAQNNPESVSSSSINTATVAEDMIGRIFSFFSKEQPKTLYLVFLLNVGPRKEKIIDVIKAFSEEVSREYVKLLVEARKERVPVYYTSFQNIAVELKEVLESHGAQVLIWNFSST